MKKLVLAALFGITITACGTKESSASTNSTDSTAADNAARMSPSTMDTVVPAVPNDSAVMKADSATTGR
ncbi:entericidin [Chryseobacterium caseinilyticum]|uniref:Entericidin n=1 Tax=Chryseobacterium caseinilyticum TaxID=2771428 RepID=A0ABR8ZA90_9FLAO|nr:entericidin [Chryseobacterium caseinilyticum]MBD8082137.1 entericidin [Chryseobacterium caseinilyticum]